MVEGQFLFEEEMRPNCRVVEIVNAYEDWVFIMSFRRTSIDNPEWMNVNF